MLYPEYKWVDIAPAGVNSRNMIVDISTINNHIKEGAVDAYCCMYRYRDELKEKGSVKLCRDSVKFCDYIYWDFDDADNPENALDEAKDVIERIRQIGVDAKIYFSGFKGFHVFAPVTCFGGKPDVHINETIKSVALELAQGMKTVDAAVYDSARIIRYPNTINKKSGLYKIYLNSLDLTFEGIKADAKEPFHGTIKALNCSPVVDACILWAKHLPKVITAKVTSKKPSVTNTLAFAPVETNRNVSLFNMILKLNNLSEADCLWVAKKWNEELKTPLSDTELLRTINQARSYRKDLKNLEVMSFDERRAIYESNLKADQGEARFGWPLIDGVTGGLRRGEVFIIMARQGCFKTALIQNMMINYSGPDGLHIFFSFEMPPEAVFEREIQIKLKMESKDIKGFYREQAKEWERLLNDLSERMKNYLVYPRACLSIDDIIAVCENCKTKYGKKIAMIYVDYIGYVEGKGNEYEKTTEVVKKFKTDVARQIDVPVILISQANRQAQDGTSELQSNFARGSGAIEETADFLLGIWREEESDFATMRGSERIIGKFFKHRRNEAVKEFGIYPYFEMEVAAEHMTIKEFKQISKPKRKTKGKK